MRPAFTLIELLMALTIIATLAALLLPAVSMVRGSARTTQCGSNQRQIGIALLSYTTDWDDRLPWGTDSTAGATAAGTCWNQKLMPILAGRVGSYSRIFTCPQDPRQWALRPRSYVASGMRTNPNGTMDGWAGFNTSRLLTVIQRPSTTVLLMEFWEGSTAGEAFATNLQWSGSWAYVPGWLTSNIPPRQRVSRKPYYHGRVENFLYADGHVQAAAPGSLYRSGTDNDWCINR